MLALLKRFWTWFDHQVGGCFWEYPVDPAGDPIRRRCPYCHQVEYFHVLKYPRGHGTEWRRDRPYNYYKIMAQLADDILEKRKEQADRGC